MEQATVDAVMDDWRNAPVSEQMKGALQFLEIQTLRPQEINEDLLKELQGKNLDRAAIEDLAGTGFHFNFINRIADAFDFPLPDPKQQKRQARFLDFSGRRSIPGEDESQSWTKSDDDIIRPVDLDEARQILFSTKGTTDPLFLRSVEYFAAEKWGGVRSEHRLNIPGDLYEYLENIALHAYRITDEMVNNIKAAGYTDRELYEITFAAALGASMPALENLFGVLYPDER